MDVQETNQLARLFIVVNPSSGNCSPAETRQMLGRHFGGDEGLEYRLHELVPGEDLLGTVREAVRDGFDVVVAAGGDGTVSTVANGLVGTEARLGIIPLGTTNVLARELAIPLEPDAACRLLAGPNATALIDGMRVEDAYCFTQIGIGLDALMIRDTTVENKKRFGGLAYLWTAALRLVGSRGRRFSISVDGSRVRPRAKQILLVNCGTLGTSGLRWGQDIRPDDGRIAVCIVRANTVLDHLSVAWSVIRGRHHLHRNIQYLTAEQTIAVHADHPLPIQADGEVIGETPLVVRVVPRALQVVVPANVEGHSDPIES